MRYSAFFFLFLLLGISACSSKDKAALQFKERDRDVPDFNADNAYHELKAQVKFGPRNPGSKGHKEAESYLINRLKKYAGSKKVFAQHFVHHGYKGDTLRMANIIASFNPTNPDRIMLCAHWDTRPRADQDSVHTKTPILGADDGASGTALLLELARIFSNQSPPVGIDIILFDGEDYGKEGDVSRYFLGSRYWSNHPPVKNYHPRFGILLDMVAGRRAIFPKEGNSMQFAPSLVNEIWNIADEKGYGSVFVDEQGGRISDDHLPLYRIRKIPAIDIVRHSLQADGSVKFAPYWHTHKDNLKIIDKKTLNIVGVVLTSFIYNHL